MVPGPRVGGTGTGEPITVAASTRTCAVCKRSANGSGSVPAHPARYAGRARGLKAVGLALLSRPVDAVRYRSGGTHSACTGKVVRVKGEGLVRVEKDNDPKNRQGVIALPDFAVEM